MSKNLWTGDDIEATLALNLGIGTSIGVLFCGAGSGSPVGANTIPVYVSSIAKYLGANFSQYTLDTSYGGSLNNFLNDVCKGDGAPSFNPTVVVEINEPGGAVNWEFAVNDSGKIGRRLAPGEVGYNPSAEYVTFPNQSDTLDPEWDIAFSGGELYVLKPLEFGSGGLLYGWYFKLDEDGSRYEE